MSENISNELPVITSIEDLPETAIDELTGGNEPEVVEERPVTKAAAKPEKVEAPVEEATEESAEEAPAKPKRKRRTKAEMEAARAAEKAAKEEE